MDLRTPTGQGTEEPDTVKQDTVKRDTVTATAKDRIPSRGIYSNRQNPAGESTLFRRDGKHRKAAEEGTVP